MVILQELNKNVTLRDDIGFTIELEIMAIGVYHPYDTYSVLVLQMNEESYKKFLTLNETCKLTMTIPGGHKITFESHPIDYIQIGKSSIIVKLKMPKKKK